MKKLALGILCGCACVYVGASEEIDIKRTAWGDPDFSGTYDIATLTPMNRPDYFKNNQFLTPEQAKQMAAANAQRMAAGSSDKSADRGAPPVGGDGSPGAAGNVGGYNSFWIENGEDYNLVDGKFRTSIVYYPDNGRQPGRTDEAIRKIREFFSRFRTNTGRAYWLDAGWENRPGPYDNPEGLTLADRCLLGFSSTGGPPMMPALYNNIKRIVQSPDTIMILVEMVHDARIVRMNAEHAPDDVRNWLGDSVGHWEDDTLVIDTTNFNDTPALGGASRDLHVIERFSRQDETTLLYDFTVRDPATWKDEWKGAYSWPETDFKLFEYACHEGNYAMGNILRGARRLEREHRTAQAN